ncbi:type IV pilin N-terminal domain-containing protein [Halalkalicoccus sp. NIPERK01]|uniref:type IV pilin N-terminal domain-containing protein n=1 Tax=Halalkalicoccus sp. NIPERK01 TaxID=3053469 RepID=UPI00256EE0A0|nr:type IV pilin N-terminal domain-containing protein [Halalkalicoccus sp. NIPERK01]MDL5362166.1 type IV pilin N-terminal domain-containing protein [Halalkalicoccus sp. NIPERK01]
MIAELKQKLSALRSGEDRGVSPVIGVILMVAITVILAAVIGAFVLGLGDGLGEGAQPNTQLTISENKDASGNVESFTIVHEGGDQLNVDEFTVRGGSIDDTAANHEDVLTVGGEWVVDVDSGHTAGDDIRLIWNDSQTFYTHTLSAASV